MATVATYFEHLEGREEKPEHIISHKSDFSAFETDMEGWLLKQLLDRTCGGDMQLSVKSAMCIQSWY